MSKRNLPSSFNSKWWMLSPIFLSLLITCIFYPGFMSYDTLHALTSARHGVTDSMWPPMVSYIWRGVDLVSTNPAAMHLTQLILLLSSLFYIVYFFTKRFSSAALFLFLYLLFPAILGTTAVIWKDVLMSAFFFFSLALLFFAHSKNKEKSIFIYGGLSLIMIFVATCLRHNAITGAVPIIYYAAYVFVISYFKPAKKILIGTCIIGSIFIGLIFSGKLTLDHYSLPSLAPLPSSTTTFVQLVRVLDIAGASICVGQSLFGSTAPGLSLAEISKSYEPKHINLSQSLIDKVTLSPEVDKVWLDVALTHPLCFFTNKILLTKYMIGAHQGIQFLITHPYIDSNEFGYKLSESIVRGKTVSYIGAASSVPLLKPWFFYLVSIFLFILLWRQKLLDIPLTALYLSGVFYFGGLILFGNAADARLLFYTSTCFLILIFVAFFKLKLKVQHDR